MSGWRILAYVDVVLASIPGVMCLVAPSSFTGQYLRIPVGDAGLEFVRALGGVYTFYAYLMWRGLRYGDAAFWGVWAPAALLGDVLAVFAFGCLARLPAFTWGFETWFTVAFYAIYLPFRVAVVLEPARLAPPTGSLEGSK